MSTIKKTAKYLMLLLFMVIFILFIWSSGACHNEKRHKQRQANGTVTEKFIDKENHNTYSLRLNNKGIYRIMGFEKEFDNLSKIYDSIIVGDSLIKEKGSLDMVIIRGEQRMVFTHDTGCDENWWKFWKKLNF